MTENGKLLSLRINPEKGTVDFKVQMEDGKVAVLTDCKLHIENNGPKDTQGTSVVDAPAED